MFNSLLGWLNKQLIKNKTGNNLPQINQLKLKDSDKTLGEIGGIEKMQNILLDGELSKFGLLKMGYSIFDSNSVVEIAINQENASGIKALLAADIFNITTILKREGLLTKIESLINPQLETTNENTTAYSLNLGIRNRQLESNFIKLPKEISQHVFSFLDDHSLSQFNRACTLFYNQSKDLLLAKHKQELDGWLISLDKNLTQIEENLRQVNGQIKYTGMGYLFNATSPNRNGNEVAATDYKLSIWMPKMRQLILSLLFNVKLLEARGEFMDDKFSQKLEVVQDRFTKNFGNLAAIDFARIDNAVQEAIRPPIQRLATKLN